MVGNFNLPPKVFPQRKDLNKTAAIFGRNLEIFKRFKRISTVVLFLLQQWLNISKGPRSRLDLQDIFFIDFINLFNTNDIIMAQIRKEFANNL